MNFAIGALPSVFHPPWIRPGWHVTDDLMVFAQGEWLFCCIPPEKPYCGCRLWFAGGIPPEQINENMSHHRPTTTPGVEPGGCGLHAAFGAEVRAGGSAGQVYGPPVRGTKIAHKNANQDALRAEEGIGPIKAAGGPTPAVPALGDLRICRRKRAVDIRDPSDGPDLPTACCPVRSLNPGGREGLVIRPDSKSCLYPKTRIKQPRAQSALSGIAARFGADRANPFRRAPYKWCLCLATTRFAPALEGLPGRYKQPVVYSQQIDWNPLQTIVPGDASSRDRAGRETPGHLVVSVRSPVGGRRPSRYLLSLLYAPVTGSGKRVCARQRHQGLQVRRTRRVLADRQAMRRTAGNHDAGCPRRKPDSESRKQ